MGWISFDVGLESGVLEGRVRPSKDFMSPDRVVVGVESERAKGDDEQALSSVSPE